MQRVSPVVDAKVTLQKPNLACYRAKTLQFGSGLNDTNIISSIFLTKSQMETHFGSYCERQGESPLILAIAKLCAKFGKAECQ